MALERKISESLKEGYSISSLIERKERSRRGQRLRRELLSLMQLPCASRMLAGGTNVVAVEAGSALSLCIRLVCGHKLAKWTTNPITRLCSPWPPLHFRLCPLIRDLSKSPNQIFSHFPLLSSSSFPLFLILKYEMFRFHRLYLKLEISDIFPSRVFEYIQLLGASEGPILRVVDSENWKLGNYKVNGRKGRLGMEPWINSLPTLPRSRFNFRLETRLWIGRKSNSTCAPNIPSSSTKHRPLFVSNFFLRFRIRAPKTVRIFANFTRNRKNRRRSNETLDPLHLKR